MAAHKSKTLTDGVRPLAPIVQLTEQRVAVETEVLDQAGGPRELGEHVDEPGRRRQGVNQECSALTETRGNGSLAGFQHEPRVDISHAARPVESQMRQLRNCESSKYGATICKNCARSGAWHHHSQSWRTHNAYAEGLATPGTFELQPQVAHNMPTTTPRPPSETQELLIGGCEVTTTRTERCQQ